ncbi:hypothetical protein [Qipengyuania vesicularis]|uniref:hypothetical protein n=1 Tax=Qipengyuania vesicularis TaxID=2867232 RepID=UPI001C868AEC|nr:hypothetical protein [Qipengyuania vesicularis]
MKIWRLARNPAQELCYRLIGDKGLSILTDAGQFGISEIGMDRLVADRMDGDSEAPLLRFRYRVMMLYPRADLSLA